MDFIRPLRRGFELNQVERWKLERHPLEVGAAVRGRYAELGPEAISEIPGELERLKWVGLYPQRQGGDAFMLRVKVPGGKLSAIQARRIGEITAEFSESADANPRWGRSFCDLTTRQDVQIHWVRIGDVPRIWDLLEEVGITTVQACGDSARNVLACPVAGLDAEEVFDSSVVATAISQFFTGNREYANLPRKFKLSVTGCREDCARVEINDVGLWPAQLADGSVGVNVLVGGGLSDGPRMASDVDVFVTLDQVVELTRAVAQLFGELGNRENRGTARMRYLVQELGPEGFRAELASRARFELQPAGAELTLRYRGDHVGVHPQKQPGLSYVGCSVTVGRLRGDELVGFSRLAERFGNGEIRLASDQNLVITGVPEDRVDRLLAEPFLAKHSPFPPPFARGALACTGSEFCRFAIVETKERALRLADALDERFASRLGRRPGELVADPPLRIHLSGCPASCGQPQVADIGLRGETAHVGDDIVEALDVGFGGSLGRDAAFADWIDGAVPAEQLADSLGRVIERFLDERWRDEPFHLWARRTPAESLRGTLRGQSERLGTGDATAGPGSPA